MLESRHVPPRAAYKANLEGKPDWIIWEILEVKEMCVKNPTALDHEGLISRIARTDITKEFDCRAVF